MVSIFDDMTQVNEAEVQRMLPLVDEQRRNEALHYKHVFGQFTCLKSWLMLKELLKPLGITDLKMDFNEHGKPFLTHYRDVHFNLSHCKEAAICVISDRPVGVDVESVRSYNDSLVRYTMDDDEVREIEAAEDRAVAFIRLWTMKEAALKLEGTGISKDMKLVLRQKGFDFETVIDSKRRFIYSVCHFYT